MKIFYSSRKKRPRIKMAGVITIVILLALPQSIKAEDGVSDTEIIFGQTAALGGPAAALGLGMQEGIEAAFKEVNDAGGVNGRKLTLKTLDDGYEPDKAIVNIQQLINADKVFAVIGAVGTPTSKAIQPIASEKKNPVRCPLHRGRISAHTL